MVSPTRSAKKNCRAVLFACFVLVYTQNFAQANSGSRLEKMPADLETDFALSALPPHLRSNATVYLLDPQKGYYVAHQGTSGYICFIARTEWEWTEFRDDVFAPISYDPEGARSIFPVYLAVAAMRASGKYQAVQIRDSIIKGILTGVYKAPAKPGMSYMLAPVMRVYPGSPDIKEPITVSMPHYMLYAPYLSDENSRFKPGTQGLMLANPDNSTLGDGKAPYGYIIVPASASEAKVILQDGQGLLARLAAYKPYFKIEPGRAHHHGSDSPQ